MILPVMVWFAATGVDRFGDGQDEESTVRGANNGVVADRVGHAEFAVQLW